jgi:hypothetical protein
MSKVLQETLGSNWRNESMGTYGITTLVAYHAILLAHAQAQGHAIGAHAHSIAAALSPFMVTSNFEETPWRIWAKKKGVWADTKQNTALSRASAHARIAGADYADKHSTLVLAELLAHAKFPFIRIPVDSVIAGEVPLLLGSMSDPVFQQLGRDRTGYYDIRAQIELAVTGADHAVFYAVAADEASGKVVEATELIVPRNETAIRAIVALTAYFWQTYMLADEEPPLADAMDVLYLGDNADWCAQVAAYQAAAAVKNKLKADADKADANIAAIKAAMTKLSNRFPRVEGGGIRYSAFYRKGNIDWPSAFAVFAPSVSQSRLDAFRVKGAQQVRITTIMEK